MRPAWKIGALAAMTAAALGFGSLLLFWSLGDHDPDLPGLFDYRSATIGDGLLLPLLIGSLAGIAVLKWSPQRAAISCLAAGLGLTLSLGAIWIWLEDPSPRLNWTWTEPGHFEAAGWVHAVFLCLASAVLSGLLVYALLTLRSERLEERRPSVSVVAFISGAGIALGGLVLLDSADGAGSQASTVTAVIVIAGATALTAIAVWAGGKTIIPGLTAGCVGGLGLVAYCFKWPPEDMVLLGTAWIPALLLAIALSQPLGRGDHDARSSSQWPALIGCALGAVGAMSIVVHRIVNSDLVGTLVFLGLGVVLVAGLPVALNWLLSVEGERAEVKQLLADLPGTGGVTFYVVGAVAIAGWIGLTTTSYDQAQGALTAAEFLFDILVFTLFRKRFTDLREEEAKAVGERPPMTQEEYEVWLSPPDEPEQSDDDETGSTLGYGAVPGLYDTLYVFAGAVLSALIILLAFAAGPLGIDAVISGHQPSAATMWAAGAGAVLVLLITSLASYLSSRGERAKADDRSQEPQLQIAGAALAAILAVATAVGALPLIVGGEPNQWLLGAVGASIYTFLVVESLIFSPVKLQLQRLSPGAWLLVGVTGVASFIASYWLFTIGVWSEGGPAAIWRVGVLVPLVLGGTAILAVGAGAVLARSGTGEWFTPSDPAGNARLDQILNALFMILLAVVPIMAAAHLDAKDGTTLTLISSLAFLPGLFGAFIWIIDNNSAHHRWQENLENPNLPMWQRAAGDPDEAAKWLENYTQRMRLHGRLQNWGATAALLLATGFIVAKMLGA